MSRTTKEDLEKANAELREANERLREGYYKLEANLEVALGMLDAARIVVRQAKAKGGPSGGLSPIAEAARRVRNDREEA